MKPEPPQYPRPVPQIDIDEAPILAHTTVYCDNPEDLDDEFDAHAKRRAAKRRRIANAAVSYLRGEELFILSASLKGPFGEGWQNPWQKRQKISKRQKSQLTSDEGVEFDTCYSCIPGTGSNGITVAHGDGNHVDRVPESKKVENTKPFDKDTDGRKLRESNEVVENWLKRNETVGQHMNDNLSIPTPPRRKSRTRGMLSDSPLFQKSENEAGACSLQSVIDVGILKSKEDAVLAHSRLQSVLAQGEQLADFGTDDLDAVDHISLANSSNLRGGKQASIKADQVKSSTNTAHSKKISRMNNIENPNASPQNARSPQKHVNRSMLESHDHPLKPEAQATQSCPNSTMRLTHDNLPDKEGKEVSVKQAAVISRTMKQQTFQQNAPLPLYPSNDKTTISTVMSEVITTQLPPSAQRRPDLPVSISTLSDCKPLNEPLDSTNHVLDVFPALNENTVSEENQGTVSATISLPKTDHGAGQDVQKHVNVADATLYEEHQQAKAMEAESKPEQEMEDGIALTAQGSSQCQKNPVLNQQLDLSPSARGVFPEGKRKKTSFAEDSDPHRSTASIKNVLKVGKSTASVPRTASNQLEFDKPRNKQGNSDSENHYFNSSPKDISRLSLSGSQARNGAALRGILKSSNNQNPSHEPLGGSQRSSKAFGTSSSLKQEAQGQQRMRFTTGEDSFVVTADVDEPFDLNNAIDDLGSFLCSWDTEKEVLG